MIDILFRFPSLDDAITALGVLRSNKVRLLTDPSMLVPNDTKDAAKPAAAAAPKPTAGASDKKSSTEPAATGASTAAAPKADAPQTQPGESTSQNGYGAVADKIAAKAKTHRADVVALLKKYGAASGKELKPADYAAFSTEIDAVGAEAGDLA